MPADSPQVDDIFDAAIRRNPGKERQTYLDQACGDDVSLRQRVERLLHAAEQAGSFLEVPPASLSPTVDYSVTEGPGDTIGPYKLLQQIGEGGMGVIYMADQSEPITRRVAVKIIKPGMDTRQVIARFEAERQALAMMDHPHIAQVLDAGTTDTGRPYFVMELVKGVPITEYCDQHQLTPRERLELFLPVCHAIQHAHQKGIIHRDIKPSNVLVANYDDQAVPKIIDFGVAKAIQHRLTDKTLFTEFGQVLGTVEYMSPEQAKLNQWDVDTRSDIYSLGVLLYELLSGETPFDRQRLRSAAFDELLRIIREEEPPRPSIRFSTSPSLPTIAANRHIEPQKLSALVRGELDWIVMKSLEKDRTRRYETVSKFAEDVQHYLDGEAVDACPPSATYRFRKFARRNRTALATVVLVALAMTLGILVSTWQAVRATRAEGLAEARLITETKARTEADLARKAEAEQRRLAESERTKADEQRVVAEANFQKARETVDEYFTLVSENKLLDVPGLQPLRRELLESALRFYESSAVERTDDAAVLADLAITYLRVGVVYHLIDRNDDAVTAVDQALEVIDRLQRGFPEAREERRRLGGFWTGHRPTQQGTELPRDGEAAFRSLMRLNATWQVLSEEFPAEVSFRSDLAANYILIGDLLATAGQATNGVSYFQQAKEILLQLVREVPDDPEYRAELSRVHEQLARNMPAAGLTGQAEAECRAGLTLREQLVAEFPESPQHRRDFVLSLRQHIPYIEARDPAEAERLIHRLIELSESLAREYPNVDLYRSELASAHAKVSRILLNRGQLAEALEEARLAARLGPHDWLQHDHLRHLLNTMGDPEKTLAVMGENARLSPNSEPAHHQYGLALKEQGRLDKAVREFERGLEIIPDTPWSHYHIAGIRLRQNRLPEALEAARSAVRIDPTAPQFRYQLLEALNKSANAGDEEARRELPTLAEEVLRELITTNDSKSLNNFAWSLGSPRALESKIAGLAVQAALRACELRPRNSMFLNTLGVAQYRQGDYAAANASLRRSRYCAATSDNLGAAIDCYFLAMSNAKLGHAELAERWFRAAELCMALFAATNGELAGFRQEAIDVLGIEAEPLIAASVTPETEQELLQLCLAADPDSGWIHHWLGARLADRGAWAEADEHLTLSGRFENAVETPDGIDENVFGWEYERALLYIQTEQLDAYRRLCRNTLERIGKTNNVRDASRVGIQCKLAPNALADYSPVLGLLKHAVDEEPGNRLYRGVQAHLLFRSGDAEAAVKQLEQLVSSDKAASLHQPFNKLFLALAHHDLGHDAEAERYFHEGADWIDRNGQAELRDGAIVSQPLSWTLRLELMILRAEAEQVLGITQPRATQEDVPLDDVGENPKS